MGYSVITDIDKIVKQNFAQFVLNHPHGNIFQSPEMYGVIENTKNYEPILIILLVDEGIIASLLAIIIKEYNGFLGNLTSRSVIIGGPLIKDNHPILLKNIFHEYNRIIKKKVIYTQVRNMWDTKDQKHIFNYHGYSYEDHLNILIDLNKSEEQLWKEVNSKRRNEIKRAEREGTSVKVITRIEEVYECIKILKEVYKNSKLPFPDVSLFVNSFNKLGHKGLIKFFGAYNEEKLIGIIVVFTYKNTIYDWYAGSYREYYKKYPNDLLPWVVFKWGKENRYELFDFGGAGMPNKPYGVRDYKKKFGGEVVNYGRYNFIHKKILMNILTFGFNLKQKL